MSDVAIVAIVFCGITVPATLVGAVYLGLKSKHSVRFDADVSRRAICFEVTPESKARPKSRRRRKNTSKAENKRVSAPLRKSDAANAA